VADVQLTAQALEFNVCVPMAGMVLAPLVRVVPLIVIAYPPPALVLALMRLKPTLVAVGENVPRFTDEPVMLVQSVPLVPTQNTKLSGIVPVTVICCAVLTATAP
jgi:hypothetical protein